MAHCCCRPAVPNGSEAVAKAPGNNVGISRGNCSFVLMRTTSSARARHLVLKHAHFTADIATRNVRMGCRHCYPKCPKVVEKRGAVNHSKRLRLRQQSCCRLAIFVTVNAQQRRQTRPVQWWLLSPKDSRDLREKPSITQQVMNELSLGRLV